MVALAPRPVSELVPSPGAVLQWRCRRLQRKGQSDHQTGVWVPHLRGTGSRFVSRTWRPARTKTHPQILLTRPQGLPVAGIVDIILALRNVSTGSGQVVRRRLSRQHHRRFNILSSRRLEMVVKKPSRNPARAARTHKRTAASPATPPTTCAAPRMLRPCHSLRRRIHNRAYSLRHDVAIVSDVQLLKAPAPYSASSAESVGEFWFGQVAKCVIQSDFQCPGGAEPIRPFGDHSGLSVEAFDNATGELPPGSEPVQKQVAVRAQPCGQPPSSGRAASASSGCTSGRGTGRPSTATRSPTAIESPP